MGLDQRIHHGWQWLVLILVPTLWAAGSLAAQNTPQFYPDIAPIVAQHCAPCHWEGGSAPFPLTDFDEVRDHARFLAEVTERRYMPPWPADPAYRAHQNERRLTDAEIQALQDWVAGGMPEGKSRCRDRKGLRYAPAGPSGRPDVVLVPDQAYNVPPDGKDHFVYFLLGEPLPRDLRARSFRFRPGNRRVVHHVELLVAPPGTLPETGARVIDDAQYYGSDFTEALGHEFEYLAGWLPGNTGELYPVGAHRKLVRGARLVLMVHYAPTTVAASDLTRLEIYSAKSSKGVAVESLDLHAESHLVDGPLFLPANSTPTFHSRLTVDSDFQSFAIFPHAHHLCTSMRAYAIPPAGDTIPLLSIPQWDFDWQFTYYFSDYLLLPAGTVIHFFATFDNTSNNPENPFFPPRDISSSFRSNDEMMELFVWGIRPAAGSPPLPLRFE